MWDGFSIADVIVLTKLDSITEIEIKTSLVDLKNDLKKGQEKYNWEITKVKRNVNNRTIELDEYKKVNIKLVTKHEIISNGNNDYYTPNKFYFCVPTELVNDTIKFAKTINIKYGVIEFIDTKNIKRSIRIRKSAKKLHEIDNSEKYYDKMIDRNGNDLAKKYRLLFWRNNEINN